MQTRIRPDSLARDDRFKRITTEERFGDPRQTGEDRRLEDRADDLADRALAFQRTVDNLFNFRGMRGEEADAAIRLARTFR